MMTTISRIAAVLLATSLLATPALAEVTGGTIVSVDPDAMTLTLDDGASYKLNSEINVSALKEGMEVYLSYNEINGENIVTDIAGRSAVAQYDGYGSCPLTVERGKIVLAEFGYGGVVKPSFPSFVIDGTKPSRAAWFLKEKMLPPIYWKAMLRGREWMAKPVPLNAK